MTSSTTNNNDTTTTATCGISSPLASCTEACQSISNIALPSNELTCLHPVHYFKLHNPNNHHVDDYEAHHDDHIAGSGSPVMYSNHAPMLMSRGLTKCEYCGSSNVDRCEGVREVHDHFGEYQRKMFGQNYDAGNNNHHGNAVENDESQYYNTEDDYFHNTAQHNTTNDNQYQPNNHNDAHSTSSTSTSSQPPPTCHRPKLFFLKKRPPFANSNDGWNIQTQHRQHLFEPPSSMEGVGRGYGEVRGQLGDYCTVNYASPKFLNGSGGNNGMVSMKKGYKMIQRSHSLPVGVAGGSSLPGNGGGGGGEACGSVCGETEITFLSASHNGGRRSAVVRMSSHNGTTTNNNDSDTGRSLSPLQWVNGSEIKGVMNWFA
mmetsp:Transcript_2097/g.4584  ORF Transcript_2097/g.4584 Transcript_2097/m.4584 type:complete len:374 (+) Transcript_2097:88-1209(+)